MSKKDEIRQEIVKQKLWLKSLLDHKENLDHKKINDIEERIKSLSLELIEIEKNPSAKDDRLENHQEMPGKNNIYEFIQRMRDFSKNSIINYYSEKYLFENYYRRDELNNHFNKFIISSKSVMVLLGKAGIGKSAFVCDLVVNSPENIVVWLQDCSNMKLSDDTTIEEYITQSLNLDTSILTITNMFLETKTEFTVAFIFDSVNEFTNRALLLSKIAKFILQIKNSRIKTVMTCRLPIWNSIKRDFRIPIELGYHVAGPGSYITLDSFSENEINKIYDGYKLSYKLLTDFCDLSPQVVDFFKHPLFLKMTAEIYRESAIPKSLGLRVVFAEYIRRCLGEKGFDGKEFCVLRRIIELMYEKAKKELEISTIESDSSIGQYIIFDLATPFMYLIDQGLLSLRIEKELLSELKFIFVTYERIFEYLLAEIVIGEVSVNEIIRNLELAKDKSFIQLQGATELALSFSLLSSRVNSSILSELAKMDRPDSRQFICDVIQTIFDSGNRNLAEMLVLEISEGKSLESKLVAIQVAYQLGFDEKLISLALSEDDKIREIATIYLYERWNRKRLQGNLSDGYKILRKISSRINLAHPKLSAHALQAILSINANMFINVVDDPKSVYPFVEIYRSLIEDVPGIVLKETQDGVKKVIIAPTLYFVIDLVVNFFLRITSWRKLIGDIIGDQAKIRAILDVGEALTFSNLRGHEDQVGVLLKNHETSVTFIASSIITHHIFTNPDEFPAEIFEFLQSSSFDLSQKISILRALVLGIIARIFRDQSINQNTLSESINYLITFWHEITNPQLSEDLNKANANKQVINLWETTLLSLLIGEAIDQKKKGLTQGSEIIKRFINDGIIKDRYGLEIILSCLVKLAYQGFVDFALYTILEDNIRFYWEKYCEDQGINAISNIRAIYQGEVDSFLQSEDIYNRIFLKVRLISSFPNITDIRGISTNLWTIVAISTDINIAKLVGFFFLEFAFSENVESCLKRMIISSIEILFDPDRINIAHVQWGLAHDPKWDRFDKMNIQRKILNERPELHQHFQHLVLECMQKLGKGIFYESDV